MAWKVLKLLVHERGIYGDFLEEDFLDLRDFLDFTCFLFLRLVFFLPPSPLLSLISILFCVFVIYLYKRASEAIQTEIIFLLYFSYISKDIG